MLLIFDVSTYNILYNRSMTFKLFEPANPMLLVSCYDKLKEPE